MTEEIDIGTLEMQLAQAYTRSRSHAAREHLRAAMHEIGMDVPTERSECPRSGR
jgi:hypothetical protein